MNKKFFVIYSAKYHENSCLRVRPTCVQIYGRTDGRTELGEILTGLACRCDLFKKEVTCAVKTTEVYQLKNILCENLDLNITSVCMLKVTQQYGVVVTLYCRLLEF